YGLTEVSGRLCLFSASHQKPYFGSVGNVLGNMQLIIRNSQGQVCESNEIGNIFVSNGDCLFSGYFQEKQPAITELGFNTGDLGYRDELHNLYLAGRTDCVFKCAGQKVSTLP